MPLVLAGSWSEDVEGDREAVEALSGRPYADVEADLAVWSALDDAPLLRLGSAWRVVSKEDAWDLIFRLVTPTDLARFHELAPRVLQEPDPALDVPPARRFMASIVGEPRRYSARLQQGLADTAAFLGGYATDQVLRDGLTGKLHARRLVTAVTGNASADGTGRAWQSLADVLPLLAEAAPDTFLDAIDPGLRRDEPLLRSLFFDSQLASFGTTSPHISLVWALENIAWSSGHMSRAAHALARMAEIDPDPEAPLYPRPRRASLTCSACLGRRPHSRSVAVWSSSTRCAAGTRDGVAGYAGRLPTTSVAGPVPSRTIRGGVRGLRSSPRRSHTPSCSTESPRS